MPLSGHRYKCGTCGPTYGSPTVLTAHQLNAKPHHKGKRTVKVKNPPSRRR